MTIKDIECKELKLSKSVVYFKSQLNGRDYRYMKALSAKIVDVDANNESIKGVKIGDYFEGIIEFFPLLAVLIKEGEKEIEPTMEYYDNLPYEDAEKVYEYIFEYVNKKK